MRSQAQNTSFCLYFPFGVFRRGLCGIAVQTRVGSRRYKVITCTKQSNRRFATLFVLFSSQRKEQNLAKIIFVKTKIIS